MAFSLARPMFEQVSCFSETDMVEVRSRLGIGIFRVRAELETLVHLAENLDVQVLMAFEMV
jgi:hypothetical protein